MMGNDDNLIGPFYRRVSDFSLQPDTILAGKQPQRLIILER